MCVTSYIVCRGTLSRPNFFYFFSENRSSLRKRFFPRFQRFQRQGRTRFKRDRIVPGPGQSFLVRRRQFPVRCDFHQPAPHQLRQPQAQGVVVAVGVSSETRKRGSIQRRPNIKSRTVQQEEGLAITTTMGNNGQQWTTNNNKQ